MMTYILQALELAYDVLTAPKAALLRISREELYKPGIVIYMFPFIAGALALSAASGGGWEFLLSSMISGGIALFILTAFVHLSAVILGGHGSIRGMASCFLYTGLPANFLLLTAILESVLPHSLISLLSSAVSLWMLALHVLAVAENYGMGYIRSFIALFFPVLILLSLLFLILFAAFASLLGAMEAALLG